MTSANFNTFPLFEGAILSKIRVIIDINNY